MQQRADRSSGTGVKGSGHYHCEYRPPDVYRGRDELRQTDTHREFRHLTRIVLGGMEDWRSMSPERLWSIFEANVFAADVPAELQISHDRLRLHCPLCRQPTLAGTIHQRPGRSGPEQRAAAMLRSLDLHVHTSVDVGGHEADIALPLAPTPVVVEYDGAYWHRETEELEKRQRIAWESAGYRVVRLREPPLPLTDEWDLSLAAAYGRFTNHRHIGAAIALHVLEAGRIASMVEQSGNPRAPASLQGWWFALDTLSVRKSSAEPHASNADTETIRIGQWRTYAAALLGVITYFTTLDDDWGQDDTLGEMYFEPDDHSGAES